MKWYTKQSVICLLVALLITPTLHAESKATLDFKVTGVSTDVKKNILKRLEIEKSSFEDQLDEQTIKDIYAQSETAVIDAIEPFGYFQSSISKDLSHTNNRWVASYIIDPGPLMKISDIKITFTGEGENNKTLQRAMGDLPTQKGESFTTKRYQRTKTIIFNIAHDQGYPNISLTKHQVLINKAKNRAEIILEFKTGPRYYFGKTTFDEKKFDVSFLEKFLTYQEGDVYSSVRLQKLQNNLNNTKYFSQVVVTPDITENKDNKAPITIHTTPVPAQQYKIGLGYGTNTGFRTSLGLDFHRLTRTGQHASAVINLSEVNTGLVAKYYFPGPQPARNEYTIGSTIQEFTPDSGSSYSRSLSTGYDTSFNKMWTVSSNMNYLHDYFHVGDDPSQTADIFYPSIYISRLDSNQSTNPTQGNRISLTVKGSAPELANSFIQSELSVKLLQPLPMNSFLLLRGDYGVTYADQYDQFPFSLRYFTGGVSSVRGYSEQDLGPGRFLQVASIELQKEIYGNFYASVFADAGNATNSTEMTLKRGLGTGVVWRSVVGPIALYVAQANSSDGKPLRVELSLGVGL